MPVFHSLAETWNFVSFPYEPEICVLMTIFNFLLVYHKRTVPPSQDLQEKLMLTD